MRVDVYWNYTKKVFSIRYKGRVSGHATTVLLVGEKDQPVLFKVSEAGRERVLRETRKNVHAVVRGQLAMYKATQEGGGDTFVFNDALVSAVNTMSLASGREVLYNPYFNKAFYVPHRGDIKQAAVAELHVSGDRKAFVTAWGGPS